MGAKFDCGCKVNVLKVPYLFKKEKEKKSTSQIVFALPVQMRIV